MKREYTQLWDKIDEGNKKELQDQGSPLVAPKGNIKGEKHISTKKEGGGGANEVGLGVGERRRRALAQPHVEYHAYAAPRCGFRIQ